ncbi:HAD family hydrolase [Paenibacillus sp. IB182496]|uniref:HAD family hydrolase n=1 Tax=Paenibacillus sabuli TaxID=2772509 RepID=A0A927BQC7_9BACL|nr:HAD family hydrolase [Paenibacillus sabuli]MBD2843578.1 HAD family hydrolase [Paenibacillus sabuli]
MINAVLFDLDGTLLDRNRSLHAFIRDQYRRFQALQRMDEPLFIKRFIELDQRGYVWKDIVYQKLIEEFRLDMEWEPLLEDYVQSFRHHCIGFANVIETLDDLKGMQLKLGMITNGMGQFQMNTIRGLNIEGYFDAIVISEQVGLRKPDIRIFHHALACLDAEPHTSLFVGDHPVHDVDASIHAGMKGVWKEDRAFGIAPSKPHRSIKNLREIKEMLHLFE